MLEESFTFESDHHTHDDLCDRIKITIQIKCTDKFLEKYSWNITNITNIDEADETKSQMTLENFSKTDQHKITIIATNVAAKNTSQAFSNYLDNVGERQCDSFREENP